MDHLWSPWRYKYVTSVSSSTEKDTCLFCRIGTETKDQENYVVLRAARNFVLLNRYPYSTGHLLIAPYAHSATLEEADPATLEELMRLAQRAEIALRTIYHPGGFNLGFNIGECAGAGVAGHIHMHVLPRWAGDTSFVTSIGETRVLPEALETTYERVSSALKGDLKGD
jgi:ATP adenylyltransferase